MMAPLSLPFDPASAQVVAFPLRGEWVAINTPAHRVPSHGTDWFGQRYAYDFVRMDLEGRPLRPGNPGAIITVPEERDRTSPDGRGR